MLAAMSDARLGNLQPARSRRGSASASITLTGVATPEPLALLAGVALMLGLTSKRVTLRLLLASVTLVALAGVAGAASIASSAARGNRARRQLLRRLLSPVFS